MKTTFLFLVTLLLFTVPAAHGQTAPAEEELTQLLRDFLHGASVNDAEMHDRFWAEDLIYTSSSGERYGKESIMEGMQSAEKTTLEEASTIYSAEEIQVQQYGQTAVVAYRMKAELQDSGEISWYLNSGTFVNRDGEWRVVNWHATRVPD